MRTRPFRFGSLKLTPLQIFFCVLLLIVIIVIVIFNRKPPSPFTYAAILSTDEGMVVSFFSSLNPSSSKIIKDPNHTPNVITQLSDKSIIAIGLNRDQNGDHFIYTIDTNGTYTDMGTLNITPKFKWASSLHQINDDSYILVTTGDDGKCRVYQSKSLNGSWTQLENFPDKTVAVSQSKDGKTFYCTKDGVLYSFSNITDELNNWTQINANINGIQSVTQLNDGSFIAIAGNMGVLYQTTDPTLQTGWGLVNNQQIVSITEIIN